MRRALGAAARSRRSRKATRRSSCPQATRCSRSTSRTKRASTSQTRSRAWGGDGAVRLLAYDAERRALLLERCRPGTTLWELDDDAAGDVVAGLLPRLWKPPPHTLRLASDLALRWIDELPRQWHATGRPFERSLLDAAVDALRELGPTQGPLVLSNEDFHAGNVLRARESHGSRSIPSRSRRSASSRSWR